MYTYNKNKIKQNKSNQIESNRIESNQIEKNQLYDPLRSIRGRIDPKLPWSSDSGSASNPYESPMILCSSPGVDGRQGLKPSKPVTKRK
jgi:hypothetical protein